MTRRAFTLMELLVVFIVLVSLALLVFSGVNGIQRIQKLNEQHSVIPQPLPSIPQSTYDGVVELPQNKEGRYYVRIEGRKFLIRLQDNKSEIHSCE